ncbi:hypothetical protein [Pseudobutyrivibrio xylanivorans]|uniref:Uncharacterized protein n=1 Tax=Pseudobutyrivibrio xylanivorans DSM 14809 TaxID=1123012 RepID=A0A1M6K190_PSEXY|nr:hypothetical protein [Pseudobutyrivibrio xylanivorans]SHJ52685.1 hypothetical protein SAMN02745725_02748 [Pseudobutyrivibrio xylanivorans DSM 14809]
MGAGRHGGFGNTKGSRIRIPLNLQFFATKVFGKNGHFSEKNFEKYGAYFLGKSPSKISNEMNKHGYKTIIEPSNRMGSKAKRIVVQNTSKERNVAVVQVSPGSKRHGDTAYVKVSTIDSGKFKYVNRKEKYKSDGDEKAKIYYVERRKNEK